MSPIRLGFVAKTKSMLTKLSPNLTFWWHWELWSVSFSPNEVRGEETAVVCIVFLEWKLLRAAALNFFGEQAIF